VTSEAPTRQRLPRAEREQQMLDVAERVFAKRGYQAASMREIAAGVGVSSTMLFSYFDSKEGLFVATAERARGRTGERLLRAVEEETGAEAQLRGVVGAFFEMVEEDRHLFEVLATNPPARTLADGLGRMRATNVELIAELLRRTVPARIDAVELTIVARMLEASVFSVAQWWIQHPEVSRERVTDQTVASARGLIAGLARS
jgi:AcrR family transcriptional regulator